MSLQSNIHAAFEEWLAATQACEAPRAEDTGLSFRRYGHALAALEMESDYLVLYRIETVPEQRGKGHANRLLELLIGISNRHQVTLLGQANAYDSNGLPQALLLSWYERHAFEVDHSHTSPPLVWYPRKP
ncbi:MAG: N-acetyltransferase [Nitrococcus sp.]|nr:N-acetyltransferase [Nitrococcus sp.]